MLGSRGPASGAVDEESVANVNHSRMAYNESEEYMINGMQLSYQKANT